MANCKKYTFQQRLYFFGFIRIKTISKSTTLEVAIIENPKNKVIGILDISRTSDKKYSLEEFEKNVKLCISNTWELCHKMSKFECEERDMVLRTNHFIPIFKEIIANRPSNKYFSL